MASTETLTRKNFVQPVQFSQKVTHRRIITRYNFQIRNATGYFFCHGKKETLLNSSRTALRVENRWELELLLLFLISWFRK